MSLSPWSNKLKMRYLDLAIIRKLSVLWSSILVKAWNRIYEQGFDDSSVICRQSLLWFKELWQAFVLFFLSLRKGNSGEYTVDRFSFHLSAFTLFLVNLIIFLQTYTLDWSSLTSSNPKQEKKNLYLLNERYIIQLLH